MAKHWIKNQAEVATSEPRQTVVEIIEAGFDAINTEAVIRRSVTLTRNILSIKEQQFDLGKYNHVYVIGFGKASCKAAFALEQVLGSVIKQGIVIGLEPVKCEYIQTYGGNHPLPSVANVELSEKILELSKSITEKDLVIVIVSGGGSALLCWPMEECKQAQKLYKEFLRTGGDIIELNTIRKHISLLKGGGLAKYLYPAEVVGLVFCDVPGDHFEEIASGPTYKDATTIEDAKKIIEKYGLGEYTLSETPKDDRYFEKVTNIPLVSNDDVLQAMADKASVMGLKTKILSAQMYDPPERIVEQFTLAAESGEVLLGAGEARFIVTTNGGTGGRCLRIGMAMLPHLQNGDVFAAVASDGQDNSDVAGVVEDSDTIKRMNEQKLNYSAYMERFDSYTFYKALGHELLSTGPTEANVSDFMVYYRP